MCFCQSVLNYIKLFHAEVQFGGLSVKTSQWLLDSLDDGSLCVSADMTHWSVSTAQRKSSVCSVVNILLLAQRWVILNNKTLCVWEREDFLMFSVSSDHVSISTQFVGAGFTLVLFITHVKAGNMSELMFTACPAACWSLTRSNKQRRQISRTFIDTGTNLNHSWSQMCVCDKRLTSPQWVGDTHTAAAFIKQLWNINMWTHTHSVSVRAGSSSGSGPCCHPGLQSVQTESQTVAAGTLLLERRVSVLKCSGDSRSSHVLVVSSCCNKTKPTWIHESAGKHGVSSSSGPSRVCVGGTDLKLVF